MIRCLHRDWLGITTKAWEGQTLTSKNAFSGSPSRELSASGNTTTSFSLGSWTLLSSTPISSTHSCLPGNTQTSQYLPTASSWKTCRPSDSQCDLSIEALFGSPTRPHAWPRTAAPSRREIEQVNTSRTVLVDGKQQQKRRQYACKVCSILRRAQPKSAWETIYLCRTCSNAQGSGVIYICQRIRQYDPNGPINTATCSQIWHDMWRNGTDTPEGVQFRRRALQDGRDRENEASRDE